MHASRHKRVCDTVHVTRLLENLFCPHNEMHGVTIRTANLSHGIPCALTCKRVTVTRLPPAVHIAVRTTATDSGMSNIAMAHCMQGAMSTA